MPSVELPPLDMEAPGPFRYGEAGRLVALLDRAGFRDLEVHDWRGKLAVGGGMPPAEPAHLALSSMSSFSELLAKASDEAFNKAHQLLTRRFSQHQQNSVVTMDACVHIVTGSRLRKRPTLV